MKIEDAKRQPSHAKVKALGDALAVPGIAFKLERPGLTRAIMGEHRQTGCAQDPTAAVSAEFPARHGDMGKYAQAGREDGRGVGATALETFLQADNIRTEFGKPLGHER